MFLQAPGFESLVPFIGVSKQGPCFTAVEEEVNSRPPRKGALQEFFPLVIFRHRHLATPHTSPSVTAVPRCLPGRSMPLQQP